MAPKVAKSSGKIAKSAEDKPKSAEDKPKKKSPFFDFCAVERENVKQNNPDMSSKDRSKVLGTMWNNLSDNEKAAYGCVPK